jgi:hypothetical protein
VRAPFFEEIAVVVQVVLAVVLVVSVQVATVTCSANKWLTCLAQLYSCYPGADARRAQVALADVHRGHIALQHSTVQAKSWVVLALASAARQRLFLVAVLSVAQALGLVLTRPQTPDAVNPALGLGLYL